jgi:hypothetical protein
MKLSEYSLKDSSAIFHLLYTYKIILLKCNRIKTVQINCNLPGKEQLLLQTTIHNTETMLDPSFSQW